MTGSEVSLREGGLEESSILRGFGRGDPEKISFRIPRLFYGFFISFKVTLLNLLSLLTSLTPREEKVTRLRRCVLFSIGSIPECRKLSWGRKHRDVDYGKIED